MSEKEETSHWNCHASNAVDLFCALICPGLCLQVLFKQFRHKKRSQMLGENAPVMIHM